MKTNLLIAFALLFGFVQCQFPVSLSQPLTGLDLSQIANPTSFASLQPISNDLLVASQDGTIYLLENNATVSVFYKIADIYYNETTEFGLYGFTFQSNSSTLFFFYAANRGGNVDVRISSVQWNSSTESFGNLTLVIDVASFNGTIAGSVVGGAIGFGPDGFLYIGVGDGEVAYAKPTIYTNNSQDVTNCLGKILRISPLSSGGYSIPSTNPFVRSTFARPEIYALGLRQPFRFSWDSKGNLWCPDVGDNAWEEINIITAGSNYGWPVFEGLRCNQPPCDMNSTQFTDPIFQYPHNASLSINNVFGQAIVGGYVYEGSAIPAISGQYIFGDIILGTIFALEYSTSNFSQNSARVIANSTGELLIQFLQVENQLWTLNRKMSSTGSTPVISELVASASTSSDSASFSSGSFSRSNQALTTLANDNDDSSSSMMTVGFALVAAAIVATL